MKNWLFAAVVALSALGIHRIADNAIANSKDADWKREQILIHIAKKHIEVRDYAAAVLAAESAITLNSSNPESRNLRAAALNKLQRYQESRTESLVSIALRRKENAAAHLNLAVSNLYLKMLANTAVQALSSIR